jgi:hypothetical protein
MDITMSRKPTFPASDNRDYVISGFAFLMVNKMETVDPAQKSK